MLNNIKLNLSELSKLMTLSEANYGSIDRRCLFRSLDVIYDMLIRYPRVYALRIDLRFAIESPPDDPDTLLCQQRSDPRAITRFFESLKEQLRADHIRNNRRGEPELPAYIWCRERDTSVHSHYHVVLLFNKDVYAFLGNYQRSDADNMGVRLQKAWCSALALPYRDYTHLVEFPENHNCWFTRDDAILRRSDYLGFLFRIAYLSKQEGKISDDYRNFGTSQVRSLGH
ncbi:MULTISPECIES: inovirus Gp2 family protein [Aeromonas]|uniref:inovirus Gp2 family protein n=2 Tax=Aeromonadaceae TaxID=84642 RepID=UPI001D09329D|nr:MULTISPECIES: inovirus Gp2 family protein [Aeromonas]MDH1637830.1 inovirus Gp2 family protein [Aeromonas caviae]